MKNSKYGNLFILLALAALFAVAGGMLYTGNISRQMTNMLIPISMYIVLAVSLNLVVGLLGELSLGHAGFMSAGLFSGCLVSIKLDGLVSDPLRFVIAMLVGGLVAAVLGFIVGLPTLRLRGDYLAITTLACGEIIKTIITNLKITGGARGLDTGHVYSNAKTLFPYAVVLVFMTVIVMMNIKNSAQGRAIMAIRDNRIAAESIGINVVRYKLAVFVIAAFFAGMAGVLYGHCFANIKASSFDYNVSIEILVIVVLGGMGNIFGSIAAAVILRALPELLRGFESYRMLIYAVVLILVMVLSNNKKVQSLRYMITGKLRKRLRNMKKAQAESKGGEANG